MKVAINTEIITSPGYITKQYQIPNNKRTNELKFSKLFKDPLFTVLLPASEDQKSVDYVTRRELKHIATITSCRESAMSGMRVGFKRMLGSDDVRLGVVFKTKGGSSCVKQMETNMRKAIKIINSIERYYKWDKSEAFICKSKEQVKAIKSKHPDIVSIKLNKGVDIVVGAYKPSPIWYTHPSVMSIFMSIVRMSYIGLYNGVLSYNKMIERNKQIHSAVKNKVDTIGCLQTKEVPLFKYILSWSIILDNIKSIYNKSDKNLFKKGDAISGTKGSYWLSEYAIYNLLSKNKQDVVEHLYKNNVLGTVLIKKLKVFDDMHSAYESCVKKFANTLENIVKSNTFDN